MESERAVRTGRILVLAALTLAGLSACRKPAPPPEPPPIETTPTAGESIAPAHGATSGSSSDTPP
jgi:hypothetical protein